MKKAILILGIFIICNSYYAAAANGMMPLNSKFSHFQNEIDNGWYKAFIVIRHESGDVTKDTVKVKVEIGYVVQIVLSDGKSYNSGHNTEGYEYTNGRIYFKSLSEDKSDASASVEIKDINGGINFMILLENYQSNRISEF